MESLINNMLFGVVISLIAFELALLIRKKNWNSIIKSAFSINSNGHSIFIII